MEMLIQFNYRGIILSYLKGGLPICLGELDKPDRPFGI